MKTCKNCSTLNEVHVHKCIACNMENHFTLHAAADKEIFEEPTPKATVKCQNCGDQQLAEETHCSTCRFPLAEVKVKTITSLSAKLGRRVG